MPHDLDTNNKLLIELDSRATKSLNRWLTKTLNRTRSLPSEPLFENRTVIARKDKRGPYRDVMQQADQ